MRVDDVRVLVCSVRLLSDVIINELWLCICETFMLRKWQILAIHKSFGHKMFMLYSIQIFPKLLCFQNIYRVVAFLMVFLEGTKLVVFKVTSSCGDFEQLVLGKTNPHCDCLLWQLVPDHPCAQTPEIHSPVNGLQLPPFWQWHCWSHPAPKKPAEHAKVKK